MAVSTAAAVAFTLTACDKPKPPPPTAPSVPPVAEALAKTPLVAGEIRPTNVLDSSVHFRGWSGGAYEATCGSQTTAILLNPAGGEVPGFSKDTITTVVDDEKIVITWGKQRGEHAVIVNSEYLGYVTDKKSPTTTLKKGAWGGRFNTLYACSDPI